MTENTKNPAAYRDNMLLATISALVGKPTQKIKATIPIEELSGDYLANLVAGLTPQEREYFAASLDMQIFTHNMKHVSAITEPHEGPGPHWISALYEIIYAGDKVIVEVIVNTCRC
nr:MAG TPA: hypothetical protein [Caudoviricetes sp.]